MNRTAVQKVSICLFQETLSNFSRTLWTEVQEVTICLENCLVCGVLGGHEGHSKTGIPSIILFWNSIFGIPLCDSIWNMNWNSLVKLC